MSQPSVKELKVRINRRALIVVTTLAVLSVAGFYAVVAIQSRRIRGEALAVVKRLQASGDRDLAVMHLDQFMAASNVTDSELLLLRARLVDRTGPMPPDQLLNVARSYESIVRFVKSTAADKQAARKRLSELYVRYADLVKESSAFYQITSDMAVLESRYHTADAYARQYLANGATEPSAHRLLGEALDGVAAPGDKEAIDRAIRAFDAALLGDPTDLASSNRLANLYLSRLKDPARAETVYDQALRAAPKSLEVRLARHRFFVAQRKDKRATDELAAAVALAPGNLSVLLAAAEDALRRGDTESARGQLANLPPDALDDFRVKMVRGLIDYGDERPDEAVAAWREGLKVSAGTDAEVTWWLAYALLQMGRISEAQPLMEQYQRLAGPGAPLNRFLIAVFAERTGRPSASIRLLERTSESLPERYKVMVYLTLGRCYESLFDPIKAGDSYSRAIRIDPTAVVPRLSLAKLKVGTRPIEGIDEVRRGLGVIPGDPALRIALAGALLREEVPKEPRRRSWGEFDRAFAQAAESSPKSSAVILMHVDRLTYGGQPDEAMKVLQTAARQAPRNATLAVTLADALSRRGKLEEARDLLTRASSKDATGDHAAIRVALSRVLTAMNRGREARGALTDGPTNSGVEGLPVSERPQVWIALGQMETSQGNPSGAIRAYEEWYKLVPLDPRPLLILLELAIDQKLRGSVDAAVEMLKRLSQATGDREDLALRIGQAKALLFERDSSNPEPGSRDESLERAAELIKGVMTDAPELPAGQMIQAQIFEREGRTDEAINGYMRLWERGFESALPKVVELLARRQKFDTLAKLRSSTPGSSIQVDLLTAQTFLRAGDTTQAARIAESVARDLPDSPDALGWQSRMLSLLGKFDDAESALRAMAERQPESIEPWLSLLRFQVSRKRSEAAAKTAATIREKVKAGRADLVEARCLWALGNRDGADKAFEDALKTREDVEALTLAAKYYEETGRGSRAEALLTRALSIEPGNRQAARQLAVVLSSHIGDEQARARSLTVLGSVDPDKGVPEDRLALGIVLSRSRQAAEKAEAITRLDALVKDLPVDHSVAVNARSYLSRLYIEANKPAKASEIAAVSANKGTDPDAIALYAAALIQSKNPEAAEWQVDRLAALSPGDPREAQLRAKVIYDRSRPVEAASALERAYMLREESPGSENLGREAFLLLVEMGPDSYPVAERLGRKIAKKYPHAAWMPAMVLGRRGRNDDAFELLQTAIGAGISRDDLNEAAKVAMKIAVAGPDPETLRRSRAVIDVATQLDPDSDELLVMAAMLRHLQGDYEDEVRIYKKVLVRRPENPVVLNNLGWALSEGRKLPAEGLACIDDLIRVAGRDPEALDTRGVILGRLGRHPEAIHDLEEVVREAPTALHHFHLANAYRLAGRLADAVASRDLALRAGLTIQGVDAAERPDFQAVAQLGASAPVPPSS